jgi:hypothetical protein
VYGPGGFAVLDKGYGYPYQDRTLRLSSDGLVWNRTVAIGTDSALSLEAGAGRWVISAFGTIMASPGAL